MSDDSERMDDGTLNDAADRRIAPARALVVGAVILVLATVVARFGMAALERQVRGVPDDVGSDAKRLAKFVEVLPDIARSPNDTAFIMGSSIAFYGVALDTFDARMKELGVRVRTYTAATSMLTPAVQIVIARQIQRRFAAQNQSVDLMLLELTPQGMTTATRESGGPFKRAALADLAAVADAEGIADVALERPGDAARVIAIAALGNEDSGQIDGLIGRYLRSGVAHQLTPWMNLQRILIRKFGDDAGGWSMQTRGEPRWLWPDTQLPYRAVVRGAFESKRYNHDELERRRVELNDAIELHIDPERVREFIQLVKRARSFATHTVVWIGPRNPEFAPPTPEGLDRLAKALDVITRETGVPIVDLGTMPELGPDDFVDVQHVTEHGGRPKLSRALAEGVARAIKREDASDLDAP